jgi:hypothetical protein
MVVLTGDQVGRSTDDRAVRAEVSEFLLVPMVSKVLEYRDSSVRWPPHDVSDEIVDSGALQNFDTANIGLGKIVRWRRAKLAC